MQQKFQPTSLRDRAIPSQKGQDEMNLSAPLEIERKFLIDPNSLPNLSAATREQILQGYLVVNHDGAEVRVRQKGSTFYQTVKGKRSEDGTTRTEVEVELSKEQFDKLWLTTEGQRIEKTRHTFEWNGNTIELDIFEGDLQGLIVAEVEFANSEAASTFTPPSWFGREITSDARFSNSSLARHGLPAL